MPARFPDASSASSAFLSRSVVGACDCLAFEHLLGPGRDKTRPPRTERPAFADPFIAFDRFFQALIASSKSPFSYSKMPSSNFESFHSRLVGFSSLPAMFSTSSCFGLVEIAAIPIGFCAIDARLIRGAVLRMKLDALFKGSDALRNFAQGQIRLPQPEQCLRVA